MIKRTLERAIKSELKLFYTLDSAVTLEAPKNPEYGDLATNVAFSMTKELKKSPQVIAEECCDKLNQSATFLDDISFNAVNGFINLKLDNRFIKEQFLMLSEKRANFPKVPGTLMLEYVSANPTGPLHIGHGRWAAMGDVIASLFRFIRADISTEFYINDAGNQIQNFYKSVEALRNNQPIPEDGYHGAYVQELAQSEADPVATILEQQKSTLAHMNVLFDHWFSERTLHAEGKIENAIAKLKAKGVTYEQEGALFFKSTDFGDDKDRVLIKADGAYTYFAVDIAYHTDKIERGFDRLINIWGADHHGYVARMRAAVAAQGGEKFAEEHHFKVIIGQLVSLFRDGEPVRMSKRTGEMITLDEVIEEIGADAARYFLIEKSNNTHLDFDLELAKKKSNENPVFYIQYAHARICSILKKCEDIAVPNDNDDVDLSIMSEGRLHARERELMLFTLWIYDEIYAAALACAPHRIAQYTWQLARMFHLFYEACPITQAPAESIKIFRLRIIRKLQFLLQSCIGILGISAPEVM